MSLLAVISLRPNAEREKVVASKKATGNLVEMIVKVQRPITTTASRPQILIYNQDRSVLVEYPLTKAFKRMFGNKHRMYVHARYNRKQESLNLGAVAEDQPW